MSGVLLALALVATLSPAERWRDRQHWDWGQHDTGDGLARAPNAVPGEPGPDAPEAPVRWAEPAQ